MAVMILVLLLLPFIKTSLAFTSLTLYSIVSLDGQFMLRYASVLYMIHSFRASVQSASYKKPKDCIRCVKEATCSNSWEQRLRDILPGSS